MSAALPGEVWVFSPKSPRDGRVDEARTTIRELCRQFEWPIQERRLPPSTPEMAGEHIREVYRRIHRARVAVLSVQEVGARGPLFLTRPRTPGWRPARDDWYSLRQLCRHKAYFLRLRCDRNHAQWASAFTAWLGRTACNGLADPRCLPLHVFSAERSWSRKLSEPLGRAAFDDTFGTAARRRDRRDLAWEHGPFHGRDPLNVAGFALPAGFHWDVKTERDVELWTPTEGWRVRRYLNVAPDASLRGQEPHAKRLKIP